MNGSNETKIFTDGSCVENDNLFNGSGWAYIIPELGIKESGKVYGNENTTARMELQAIVKALEYISRHNSNYVIYCDSKSTVGCFKGLGARKIYKDLWSEAYLLIDQVLKNDSTVRIEFLERGALEQSSEMFKHAQEVDRLAYIQANSLEII